MEFIISSCHHQNYDVAKIINDKGCLPAGEEWLERNLLVVAGVAVGIAFLQVRFFEISFVSYSTLRSEEIADGLLPEVSAFARFF